MMGTPKFDFQTRSIYKVFTIQFRLQSLSGGIYNIKQCVIDIIISSYYIISVICYIVEFIQFLVNKYLTMNFRRILKT